MFTRRRRNQRKKQDTLKKLNKDHIKCREESQDIEKSALLKSIKEKDFDNTAINFFFCKCNDDYNTKSVMVEIALADISKIDYNKDDMVHLSNLEDFSNVSNDLSKYLETDVFVNIFSNQQVLDNNLLAESEWQDVSSNAADNSLVTHDKYISLEDAYPVDQVQFDTYTETPDLLEIINDAPVSSVHYHSALLKSNCRVTSQPDWGDVYIDIHNSKYTVDPISLLKYIVSFRDECHFHEEICETIYKRLHDVLQPEMLAVRCLYARRGGIDINPERVSHTKLSHNSLSRVLTPHIKTPKQ